MRMVGVPSWRLETKAGPLAELALFVRDACGLPISGTGGDVPRLVGPVPELAHAAVMGEHQDAAREWSSWWLELLDFEFRGPPENVGDGRDRARLEIAAHQAVYDPPNFDNLADRPGLQAAARASYESFREWKAARAQPWGEGLPDSPLDWSLMKQTAEDVAFDHHVSLDAVHAIVMILPVQGIWWHLVAPGAVQCSTAAASDPSTAQALLWSAFESSVTG